MNLLKIIKIFLFLFICTSVAFAQSQHKLKSHAEFTPITIIDCKGRKVIINKPIKRIAFSSYSTGEALKIVDAWDLVVAIDGYTSDNVIFPNLNNLPRISKLVYDINYEKLFELNVDLFLGVKISSSGLDEVIEKLEPDIPVAVLNFHDPATFEENLKKLGILLGKEKKVKEYLKWYHGIINQISQKTAQLKKDQLTTYFQNNAYGGNIITFTDEKDGIPFRNELTGSINIAANLTSQNGWVQSVDPEWLVTQDIDVIINFSTIPDAYGVEIDEDTKIKKYYNKSISNPVFSNAQAVKQRRFYMVTGEFWGTPRNIICFAYLAKWFHPDLFTDFNPKKLHQEYLSRFMNINCDLDKHGVFVYPEK